MFCELAIENKGIDPEDLRDSRIVIEKVPPFLMTCAGSGHDVCVLASVR